MKRNEKSTAGLLSRDRHFVEKPLLALDALAKLIKQFANKPDFHQLIHTLILTFSGQFSVANAIAVLRHPGTTVNKSIHIGSGAFRDNLLLKSLILTPDISDYLRENPKTTLISSMQQNDSCLRHLGILKEANVSLISPMLHNDKLLGIIGMGSKVTGKPFEQEDLELFDTLVSTITPLVASSYNLYEITRLSAWYQDILNNVKQGVFAFGADNRLRNINASGCNILKEISPDLNNPISLHNLHLEDIFPQEYFNDWSMRFLKASTEHNYMSIDGLVAYSGKAEFVFDAYVKKILGDSEYDADYIITLDDVTERKKSEKTLKLTQFSIDNASVATFHITKSGGIVYANASACSSLGYTEEEILSMTIHDIDLDFPVERWQSHWEDIVERRSFTFESSHRAKDGKIFPVEITANHIEFEGQGYNLVFARDLSDEKRIEEQKLQLQEKMERAEKMESLGVLAGGVAHDLNNMLGPVVGYAELVLNALPESGKLSKHVKKIGASAQSAADLIQDLLTLARRGRYEMKLTNINDVINGFLDSAVYAKRREENPGIKCEIILDQSISNIWGSHSHLDKAVMNLVINAIDAMPDGGSLSIETSQAHFETLLSGFDKINPGEYVVLKVRDSGMGIGAADIHRVFEPYYSKKEMGSSGSGLGLSVVYGILKDHKGHYDIFSGINRGTEFILYFPITQIQEKAEEQTQIDISGVETVLIVDDLEAQREITAELLESISYQVKTATNGSDAVKYLTANTVDIVVLDMIMEKGFDGLDTYREIIKLHPNQKAVIVSGYSSTERVAKMQQLGAGPYVKKPFTLDEIGKAVRQTLDCKS